MRELLRALIISLLIATNSAAQADAESSVAEVRAAFLDYVDAENGADVDRIAEHYFPGTVSSFGPRGGHLSVSDLDGSKEELKNSIASQIAAGREISLFTRDLKIHVYGSSAVVTGYWVGSIKPAAERLPGFGPWRFSSIWVRDGSAWREAHRHTSLLEAQLPGAMPPPPPPPPSRLRLGPQDMERNLIRYVRPEYPVTAQEAQIEGSVTLEIVVDVDGAVASIRVISGHSLLRSAATDAVGQWRYRPIQLNGQPVEAVTTVTIVFPPE